MDIDTGLAIAADTMGNLADYMARQSGMRHRRAGITKNHGRKRDKAKARMAKASRRLNRAK